MIHLLGAGGRFDAAGYSLVDVSGFRSAYWSSRVTGLTILKFLSVSGFALCVLGAVIATRWRATSYLRSFRCYQVLLLLVPLVGILLGSRSFALLWGVPYFFMRLALDLRIPREREESSRVVRSSRLLRPITSRNGFGRRWREAGQKRSPAPPARING